MFEATYRVALEYFEKQTDGSLVHRAPHISRRVFLATKPAIGETISVPFFDKVTNTRFVVADVEHHTHFDPPQALSYVPEFLGEIILVVQGNACPEPCISRLTELCYRHDRWSDIIATIASHGWSVEPA